MADNMDMGLPPEYQAELEAAQRKAALAQLLVKQAMGFKGAESQGPVAARTSPLAWLANAATGYLGNKALGDSTAEQAKVKQRFSNDQLGEIARLQGLPVDQQIQEGQRSKFPMGQQLAKGLAASREKQLEQFVGVTKEIDPLAAAGAAITGKLPGSYTPPAKKGPEFGTDPQGNNYVTTYDAKGTPSVHYAPKGINFTLPGQENAMALDTVKSNLTSWKTKADSAKSVYSSSLAALDALEQGAKAGGLEEQKQALRKGLQAFGINLPATAPTESLQMAMGSGILANAEKIRPASDTDLVILRKLVGSIGTDPEALTRAIALAQAMALKDLQSYNEYIDTTQGSMKSEPAQMLFSGAKVGYETPKQLSGPIAYQMELMRQLKRQGVNISGFADSTGQPFPADATFDIRNPTSGFKGVAAPPKPQGGLKPVSQMTPAEKAAEIAALKKQLGLAP